MSYKSRMRALSLLALLAILALSGCSAVQAPLGLGWDEFLGFNPRSWPPKRPTHVDPEGTPRSFKPRYFPE
jgi:hypothetical protein